MPTREQMIKYQFLRQLAPQIRELAARGLHSREIATELGLGTRTVRKFCERMGIGYAKRPRPPRTPRTPREEAVAPSPGREQRFTAAMAGRTFADAVERPQARWRGTRPATETGTGASSISR